MNIGPLTGIKVVEIGVALAGPYCAMTLGDYGASVIKIERVGVGDDSRHWYPHFEGNVGHYFASANRNKKSIALDLKSPEGLAVARRLIAQADVVVENYRYGALARAGLDYESLAAANPRLIYCSISGFGASGPRVTEPANDLFMQAFSGGMSLTGEPDSSPIRMGLSVADLGAGLFATIAILMALQARNRTGLGQRVDTSLLEGQVAMLSYHLTQFFASGVPPVPGGSGSSVGVPYQAFKALDEWLVIAVFNERMWADFCQAVERPAWKDDPRFANNDSRLLHRPLLVAWIAEIIATRPVSHWQKLLSRFNVPNSPVFKIDEVVNDPQVQARDMIVEVEDSRGGIVRMAGLPIKMAATPGRIELPAPRLGEHTASLLQELGYDLDDIRQMAAAGAIGLHLPDDRNDEFANA
jgi:crotonobetainyl-CoA:carnitine CoA-transferase CaiB-like acyl-CoA transferase